MYCLLQLYVLPHEALAGCHPDSYPGPVDKTWLWGLRCFNPGLTQ